MKQGFAIILIQLYLLSIAGLNMNVHHCGGTTSYEIFGASLNACCNCNHNDRNHSSDCCHNHKVVIKAADNDKINRKIIIFNHFENPLVTGILHAESPIHYGLTGAHNQTIIKPDYPPRYAPPIYLLDKTFLI